MDERHYLGALLRNSVQTFPLAITKPTAAACSRAGEASRLGGLVTLNLEDIFSFWKNIGPDVKIHPEDDKILRRDSVVHKFELDCLPVPFYGPLKTAPVVLLFLNPGFSEKDIYEARDERERQFYWRQRQGSEPLRSQTDIAKKSWWVSRTRRFHPDPEYLRHRLAVLELCPYHSKEFKDGRLIGKLPSTQTTLAWANKVLFPQARAKKRVVLCMRAAKRWGLSVGQHDGWLFVPHVTRNGHLIKDHRDSIVEAVRTALDLG